MSDVKLKTPVTFGPFYAFSLDGKKEIIVLN
jgi:hypothetical protein